MWLFKKRTKELVQELVQDSIRYGDFKYIRKFSRNEEVLHPPKEALYNLAEDLQEQNNLLEDIDMRAKYKELKQKMRRQLTRLGQCPNDRQGSFELSGGGPNVGMSISRAPCVLNAEFSKKSRRNDSSHGTFKIEEEEPNKIPMMMKIAPLLYILLQLRLCRGDEQQPNIVVIMTDEHNLRTISSYHNHLLTKYPKESVDVWGNDVFVETPYIDSIASEGVLFSNFYTSFPQCTRKNLGKRPARSRKWHLDGKQKPGWYAKEGREFGFSDNKYRFNTGNWKCLEELSNGRFAAESDLKKCKDLYGNDLSKHYTTDFLFARGMEFIEDTVEEDNMPFALFLSIVDPHSPDIVRQPYDKMYANVDVKVPETTIRKVLRDPAAPLFHYENANAIYNVTLTQDEIEEYHQNIDEKLNLQNHVRQYFGMVKLVDDKVGELLNKLEKLQIDSKTIVIFTSDHCDLLGEYGRLNKNMPYETSAKVPLIIKYLDKLQKGKIIETAYSQVDFAPTLLGILNLEHGLTFDGVDGSKEVLQNGIAMRNDDKQKIVFTYAGFWVTEKIKHGWIAAITNGFKFILDAKGEPTFFDLNTDSDELYNVVSDPSYVNVISLLRDAAIEQLRDLDPWKDISTIYLDPLSCIDSWDVLHTENGSGWETDVFCENLSKSHDLCKQDAVRKHCPFACGVKCKDSIGEFIYEGLTMKCDYVSRSYCHSRSVSLFCPSTCGCYNNDNFLFSTPSRAKKTCSYIMQNKKKAAQRRNAICKELKISDMCKWSCGMCNDSIKDDEDFRFPTGKKFCSCEFTERI